MVGLLLGLGLGLGAGGGGTPAPLDPTQASQAPLAIYSLNRVNPAYAGNALQVRDSGNTTRTIGFNPDGTLNTSALSGYGDGVTFNVSTWYDQSGNAHNATTAVRPKLIFPNAPTNYNDPYIEFYTPTGGIMTTTTPLNIGGTNNLAVFVAYNRLGYGSGTAPYPRPGTASTTASATLLGYGTASSGKLMTSVAALGTTQSALVGSNPQQDSLGRSVAVYKACEALPVEESVPGEDSLFVNSWFNQRGALVSAGGDTRIHWTDRLHGETEALSQRIVIGGAGNQGTAHNGGIKEVIIFNPATPLSDAECQRIGIWQHQRLAGRLTQWSPRYFILGLGQSNMNSQFDDDTSGDGSAGSMAIKRRFIPKLAEAINVNAERFLISTANTTMVGGTAMLKRAMPGDAARSIYWWDEDSNGPGNLMSAVQTGGVGGLLPYLDAIPGVKYKRVILVHAQGEEDATAMTSDARIQQWAEQTLAFWNYIRNYLGQANAPVIVQPLARYTTAQTNIGKMRRLQASYLGAQPNVYLAADTGHLARGTIATSNYPAHFGSMAASGTYAYDPTTGGAEDGYQRAAWQNALAAAKALEASVSWRGPEVTAAQLVSSGTIDATIAFPEGCAGTDFASISGTYDGTGWRVTNSDGSVTRTITGASKTGGKIRLLVTGAAVGDKVYYEPNYAQSTSGNAMTHLRDNNPVLSLPVASSLALDVT